MAGVIILACASPLVETARRVASFPGRDLAVVAERLQSLGVKGPIASNHWHRATTVAYRLGTSCVGVPTPSAKHDELEQLARVGAVTFLSFEDEVQPAGASELHEVGVGDRKAYASVSEGTIRLSVIKLQP